MRFTKNSDLYIFIDSMIKSEKFIDSLDRRDYMLLLKTYMTSRYRKRHKQRLNKVREEWIIYNKTK